MNSKKFVAGIFSFLVIATLLTPFWVFKDLLFPFITSKAYYLRILVELALPFYLYLVLISKQYRPSYKNPLSISILVFLLINIISGMVGVDPLRSFWGNMERMGGSFYLAHLTLLYFYILLLGQLGQEYMRRFLLAVISIGAIMALDGIMVQLTKNHFFLADPSYPNRISATFGNPIFLASFLILPMFLTLYYLVGEEKFWKQGLYGAVVILELYCILLSQTRGAIVGLAAALFISAIVYVSITSLKKIRLWGGVGIAVFTILVVLAFTQHNKFPETSLLRRVFNLKDSNTEARLIQWKVALTGYKDRPIWGTGPENYYVISNKHYNPEIYKYDPSWFDKPHNYILEILVTTGILGFAAYAFILIFFVWALVKALKKDLINSLEFCLLLGGFLTYEFQNLFVFDTVSASMMYFVFMGFGGYLWYMTLQEDKPKKKLQLGLNGLFVNTAFGIAIVISLYIIFTGNVEGMKFSKAVNYGVAYGAVDPHVSQNFYEQAQNSMSDFDPVQFAAKLADSTNALASDPKKENAQFINQSIDRAITVETEAVQRVPNDPTSWQELANLYLTKALFNKAGLDPKAVEASKRAVELAPRRPEPAMTLARLQIFNNDISGAEKTMKEVIANIPNYTQAEMQLAELYFYSGNPQLAATFAEKALAAGYKIRSVSEVEWLGKYYAGQQDWQNAARIYELAVQADPNNLDDYFNLAKVYAELGQKDRAIAMAQAISHADPAREKAVQDFIKTLK